jgi:hypothetical protein
VVDSANSHSSPMAGPGTYIYSILTLNRVDLISHICPLQCNPELSALITKTLKIEKSVWLKDLTRLKGLLAYVEDKAFRAKWAAVKQRNKERLAHHVLVTFGLEIDTTAMFDVHIKVCGFSVF